MARGPTGDRVPVALHPSRAGTLGIGRPGRSGRVHGSSRLPGRGRVAARMHNPRVTVTTSPGAAEPFPLPDSGAAKPGAADSKPEQEPIDLRGLTDAEAERRRAAGQGNTPPPPTTRTYLQIVTENVFTFVNNVLFVLAIALVVVGRPLDALVSLGVIGTNVVVAIYQEIKAKRALDVIALLTAPTAKVVRDGEQREVRPEELVIGDVIRIAPGDQVVLDGELAEGEVELDESALTGESDAVHKRFGRRGALGDVRAVGLGRLRRARRRRGVAREPDHRGCPRLPPDPHADPEGDQPRHPVRARDRRLSPDPDHPRGDDRVRLARPGGRPGDDPRGPRAQRPVRLDRHRVRACRDPDLAPGRADPAVERRGVAQPRRRALPRQDRHDHRGRVRGRRGASRRRATTPRSAGASARWSRA